jgi:Tfp pilus assembly protein PilV
MARTPCQRRRMHRRSLTLVEMTVCTLIVSVMLVAALNAVGAARLNECRLAENQRALLLAQALMGEILCQPYSAADEAGDVIASAAGAADRSSFNSVGDYNGWCATPPENRDGSIIPNSEGYTQAVRVVWVSAADLNVESASPTGVKCIQVSIERDKRPVVVFTGYRTAVWKDPARVQGGGS